MNGEALIKRRLLEWGEVTEVNRSDATVTWALQRRGERWGYLRLDRATNVVYLRLFYAREKWSDARAEQLRHLPDPLIGHFDVQKMGDELVCRFVLTCMAETPNRLEAALRHFLDLRAATVERTLHGEDALQNLKSTLRDAQLPVPAVAQELTGLTMLGPWWWGTRFVPPFAKYELLGEPPDPQPAEEAMLAIWDRQQFFAMSQQQHGVNTYLNVACSLGPVAVTADVQVGFWGEMYPAVARTAVARLFGLLDNLPRERYAVPKVLVAYSGYECGNPRIWHLNQLVPLREDASFGPDGDDLETMFEWAIEGGDRG